jgi:hypothetical protein
LVVDVSRVAGGDAFHQAKGSPNMGTCPWEPDHSTHQFYKLFANRESETCQIRTYFKRRPDHPIDRRRRAR